MKRRNLCVPVAVFAYQRPQHLHKVLEALEKQKQAPETKVTIFVDGPKSNKEKAKTLETIKVAKKKRNFYSLRVIQRKTHRGLARAVVSGINDVLEKESKIIVLEDDTVPLDGFLEYMNAGLKKYEKNKKVFQVAGFNPQGRKHNKIVQFIPLTSSWGWGTWKRAWKNFRMKVKIPRNIDMQAFSKEFDLKGSYPFSRLLADAANKKSESWAIRWYYACFLSRAMVSYPPLSYVENIGNDGTGQHEQISVTRTLDKPRKPSSLVWPERVVESAGLLFLFKRYLRGKKNESYMPTFQWLVKWRLWKSTQKKSA